MKAILGISTDIFREVGFHIVFYEALVRRSGSHIVFCEAFLKKFWARGGKWWQVVASGGKWWRGRRNGGARSLLRRIRRYQNSTEFGLKFHTLCTPSGAADLNAARIPPGLGPWSKRLRMMARRWPQDGPKKGPRGPKMAPRRGQEAQRWPQEGAKRPKDGPKMAPRWPQEAQRWPQDGPKRPQDGPKMPQDGQDQARWKRE